MLRKFISFLLLGTCVFTVFGCGATDNGDVLTDTAAGKDDTPDAGPNASDIDTSDNSAFDAPVSGEPVPGMTADFKDITAAQWVSGIRMGWNLGNTFDAHAGHGASGFSWLGGGYYADTSVEEMEAAWVNHTATKELIDALSAAGFNAIRIPVTWFKATDGELNIREDWMERVAEVVGWVMDADMYVILNTHHDEEIFKFTDSSTEESLAAFAKIWEQIAVRFRDFGEKLAFEGLNEPRTTGSSNEWTGGTPQEHKNLNRHHQVFVDTVRATGGNNAYRVLIVTTYAASTDAAAQRALEMPADTVADRIAVSLHMYAPWEFALKLGADDVRDEWDSGNPRDTDPITKPYDMAGQIFTAQGIPVIVGEMGALNRDNIDARVAWTEFYVSYTYNLGFPCFWWDNGMTGVTAPNAWGGWDETFGIINRATAGIEHPGIVDAMLKATE